MNNEISYFQGINIEKDRFYHNKFLLLALKTSKITYSSKTRFCIEISIRDGAYILLLDWQIQTLPDVFILYPRIDMSNWLEIHTYGLQYNNIYQRKLPLICLWYPKKDEWMSDMPLVESILPWAIEWTEFYELWLLTGVWYGRGEHPTPRQKKK